MLVDIAYYHILEPIRTLYFYGPQSQLCYSLTMQLQPMSGLLSNNRITENNKFVLVDNISQFHQ